jgi:uncharacterized protein with ParB-like and HNH nuclease domain
MTFDEWFEEVELFSTRSERFFDDLDHHKMTKGSYNRMVEWLKAAYEEGKISA